MCCCGRCVRWVTLANEQVCYSLGWLRFVSGRDE
nr:MAG TPA: S64, SPIDER VENOM PEPTIDE, ICK [Caudoviricetes sp.]